MLKKEIRIIGWDDAAFAKGVKEQKVPVVGAIIRGGDYIDGMLKVDVQYDGMDSTSKIIEALNSTRHRDQLRFVMTDGITFAGFNLLDINEIFSRTGLPVIAIIRDKPDIDKFIEAMRMFEDYEKRKKIVEKTGEPFQFKNIFYQKAGLSRAEADEIIRLSATRSNIPEPIRVAHIIATGLSGESKGRA